MKKTITQPPRSWQTDIALNYLHDLPERVIRDRYLDIKNFQEGNPGVLLETMRRHAELTHNWRRAMLRDADALLNTYTISEEAPYRPYAEASLAHRAMAAILFQAAHPEFQHFQDKFNSFEEFWCAVEWDLMYRSMRGAGLINVTEKIEPQGKRKWAEQASKFFTYLDDPFKVPFSAKRELATASQALYFYAIYYAQRDDQFRWGQYPEFVATLKRCHRQTRNNALQAVYLLEDESLVIFLKHGKRIIQADG